MKNNDLPMTKEEFRTHKMLYKHADNLVKHFSEYEPKQVKSEGPQPPMINEEVPRLNQRNVIISYSNAKNQLVIDRRS